jgi:hypothetical protein
VILERFYVQVGDLVKLLMANGPHHGQLGLVIDKKILSTEYRFYVMLGNGKIISGIPERYIEVINEIW